MVQACFKDQRCGEKGLGEEYSSNNDRCVDCERGSVRGKAHRLGSGTCAAKRASPAVKDNL